MTVSYEMCDDCGGIRVAFEAAGREVGGGCMTEEEVNGLLLHLHSLCAQRRPIQ